MKLLTLAALAAMAGGPALAQTSSPPAPAPVAGANSFTEAQARARIEGGGYAAITDLRKDDQGIWRAMAAKDGKAVAVALDFQGNVTSQ